MAAGQAQAPTIVYSAPRREAVVVVVNYAREDLPVTLNVDLKALGLTEDCAATDTEPGTRPELHGGKLQFTLKGHDLKVIRQEAKK